MVVIGVVVKMYLWWSLCTLYLRARQMRVTISNSGLCCRICVTFFKRRVLYEVVYSTGPVRSVDNMQCIYISTKVEHHSGRVGGSVIGDAAANNNVAFRLVTVRSWLNDETWVHGYKMKHGYMGPR